MTRLLAIAAIAFVGAFSACGSDDGSEGSEQVKVQVAQVFNPLTNYGEEGAAAYVQFDRDGETVASVGPIASTAVDNQDLGELTLDPGTYDVSAYQLICGVSGCEETPPVVENLDKQELACTGALKAGSPKVADVVVFVDPERIRCRIETGFVERG